MLIGTITLTQTLFQVKCYSLRQGLEADRDQSEQRWHTDLFVTDLNYILVMCQSAVTITTIYPAMLFLQRSFISPLLLDFAILLPDQLLLMEVFKVEFHAVV